MGGFRTIVCADLAWGEEPNSKTQFVFESKQSLVMDERGGRKREGEERAHAGDTLGGSEPYWHQYPTSDFMWIINKQKWEWISVLILSCICYAFSSHLSSSIQCSLFTCCHNQHFPYKHNSLSWTHQRPIPIINVIVSETDNWKTQLNTADCGGRLWLQVASGNWSKISLPSPPTYQFHLNNACPVKFWLNKKGPTWRFPFTKATERIGRLGWFIPILCCVCSMLTAHVGPGL